jgi:hypothetical protein
MVENVILLALSLIIPFNLFIMKQITDIKKTMANICERLAREETKSQIYHTEGLHDLNDK